MEMRVQWWCGVVMELAGWQERCIPPVVDCQVRLNENARQDLLLQKKEMEPSRAWSLELVVRLPGDGCNVVCGFFVEVLYV